MTASSRAGGSAFTGKYALVSLALVSDEALPIGISAIDVEQPPSAIAASSNVAPANAPICRFPDTSILELISADTI